MRLRPVTALTLVVAVLPGLSAAGQLRATIEIPRLDVAEYHRPYVAAWIENRERAFVANVTLWYDTKLADREGETWLKDLRQWWRKSGRDLEMPIDGVSGATRPVGEHEVSLDLSGAVGAQLPHGDYTFVVEASREVGGREMIRIPFGWHGKSSTSQTAGGERELGRITLRIEG